MCRVDIIMLHTDSKVPLYLQLYQRFRQDIERKKLFAGDKLPSIRELAKNLSISKITVEKAYQQLLSEGYIESSNRSRYTVSHVEEIAFQPPTGLELRAGNGSQLREAGVRYDFSSGVMEDRKSVV